MFWECISTAVRTRFCHGIHQLEMVVAAVEVGKDNILEPLLKGQNKALDSAGLVIHQLLTAHSGVKRPDRWNPAEGIFPTTGVIWASIPSSDGVLTNLILMLSLLMVRYPVSSIAFWGAGLQSFRGGFEENFLSPRTGSPTSRKRPAGGCPP